MSINQSIVKPWGFYTEPSKGFRVFVSSWETSLKEIVFVRVNEEIETLVCAKKLAYDSRESFKDYMSLAIYEDRLIIQVG